MWKKTLLLILSTLLVGSGLIQTALGQEYPTKPIELVCPYPAGGTADIFLRAAGEIASRYLGQRTVVTNKLGGGGSIAAADVISSKPDGYKLVLLSTDYFGIITKTQKIPFDPNDFVPIANLVEYRNGMSVRGDSPYKTLDDFLDYGRKNPGKLRWAHAARGGIPHMGSLLIFRKGGVETIEIPYKGGPDCAAALLGGHVDAIATNYGVVISHIKANSFRCLVVFSDRRYGDLPNVPCAGELGFADAAKLSALFGIYTHKDTPKRIQEILTDVFKKACEDPEFKKVIEKIGEVPRFEGPEFLKGEIKKTEEVGVPILKQLGLYVEK